MTRLWVGGPLCVVLPVSHHQARKAHKAGRMTAGPINESDVKDRHEEALGELQAILEAVKDHLTAIAPKQLALLLGQEAGRHQQPTCCHPPACAD